jgi:hypothetical protein
MVKALALYYDGILEELILSDGHVMSITDHEHTLYDKKLREFDKEIHGDIWTSLWGDGYRFCETFSSEWWGLPHGGDDHIIECILKMTASTDYGRSWASEHWYKNISRDLERVEVDPETMMSDEIILDFLENNSQ